MGPSVLGKRQCLKVWQGLQGLTRMTTALPALSRLAYGVSKPTRSNSIGLRSTKPHYGVQGFVAKRHVQHPAGCGLRFPIVPPKRSENKRRPCLGCLDVKHPWLWSDPPPTPSQPKRSRNKTGAGRCGAHFQGTWWSGGGVGSAPKPVYPGRGTGQLLLTKGGQLRSGHPCVRHITTTWGLVHVWEARCQCRIKKKKKRLN